MKTLIHEVSSGNLDTKFGKFSIHYFTDGREDAVALVAGNDIRGANNILCRVHSQCLFAEAFYSTECDCSMQLEQALENLQAQGGMLIYLFQNGRGHGLAPLISTQELKERGMNQQKAYEYRGFFDVKRSFDIAAKILSYFDIRSIRLITKNKDKIDSFRKYGITVTDAGLNSSVVIFDKNTKHQITYESMELIQITDKTVVIISDLNVDKIFYYWDDENDLCDFRDEETITVGGCAFNSACIFKKEGLDPVIVGSVGKDMDGECILSDLKKHDLKAFIYKSERDTGKSKIIYENDTRKIKSQSENANEYNATTADIISALRLKPKNLVYITAHLLFRGAKENIITIRDAIYSSQANIIVDIVPHNIYKKVTWDFLCEVFDRPLFMVICELKTLLALIPEIHRTIGSEEIIDDCIFDEVLEKVDASKLNTEYLVLRYGYENIGKQRVYKKSAGRFNLDTDKNTEFKKIPPKDRCGYGEVLAAQLINDYYYKD